MNSVLVFVLNFLLAIAGGQGSNTKNLSITVNASGGSATAILCPNNGQTGNSANCVQPPVLAFGKQGTSTASMAIPISVNNCAPVLLNGIAEIAACSGSGTLTLGATPFAISGTNASDFSFSLGGCTANLAISTGGSCSGTITFTPTASSGTNETATLTVTDNGTTSTQTMSLTGTSATVTTLSACGSLSSSTNYQLTTNISAPSSCITAASGADLNLNGHTITYCTTPSASMVQGVTLPNGNGLVTVHNGTITESGTNLCTGLASSQYGSSDVGATNINNGALSASIFNVTLSQNDKQGKIYLGENGGSSSSSASIIHDNIITDNDPGNCASVGCRAEDQFYSVIVDQSYNRTGAGDSFYNNTVTGGAQGTWQSTAKTSNCSNNLINLGNLLSNGSVANGFACQDWATTATIQNNLIIGNGTSGSITSGRGIQLSSVNNSAVTGSVLSDNSIIAFISNNDAEYACASFEYGSTYGIQINTAGGGFDLSGNSIQNNQVLALAGPCGGYAFSDSSATNSTGVNLSQNNSWLCRGTTGWTQTNNVNCAAMRFDGNQYAPGNGAGVEAFDSQQDFLSGDSADVYIWYDGNAPWKCSQCTFDKPSTAIAGWHLVDENNGGGSGGSSGPFYFIDPTFTGGATAASNNLSSWASNNSSLTFSYYVQWTYTVTVQQSSNSAPINGATVTMTDTNSTVECSGTTNSSGIYSCVVNDTQYKAASGSYTTPGFNPFALQISASGCTTYNQSGKTIHATTSETKQLAGC